MLDARNIYRKVTRKIYDFSPEQLQNLLPSSGSTGARQERFLDLVFGICAACCMRAQLLLPAAGPG